MRNIKEKTAIVSIALKVGFTTFKFIAFYFTGSIAILTEAWHSFTDILTSYLVYFSVRERKGPAAAGRVADSGKQPSGKKGYYNKWVNPFLRIASEYRVAFAIGFFLLFISISLFKKALVFASPQIQHVVITGILFIIFSFCSYLVYRYETAVGMKENSVALISDGMHSKADMVSSLLVGFALIVYKMGFNIDRQVAIFIAFFIFSFSIELIVNTAVSQLKQKEYSFRYRYSEIINLIFEKKSWEKFIAYIDDIFKLGLKRSKFIKGFFKHSKIVIILAALILYSMTCFYTINYFQNGIVERFGKPLKKPVCPGIHCKFPWPIDKVQKIESSIVQQINIGNVTDKNTFALIWTKQHGTEEPFLSGDNNLLYPYFVLHYKVKDIFKFAYKHKNPGEFLDNVAHRVVSNIFAKKSFYQTVTNYRKKLEIDVHEAIQKELDFFESGLEIVAVNIKDIHPPIFIADSFEDVIAAYQDKERMINEAIAYKNSSIPQARGEATEKIKNAESYVINKINRAQGESERFKLQLNSYRKDKYVTFRRFYLKCIGEGIKEKRKIIIDPVSGVPEVWLNFDKMLEIPKKENTKEQR